MSTSVLLPRTADAAAVTAELWISFVALTRSHLVALQTTGKLLQVKLMETSTISFTLGDLSGNISLTIDAATGRGTYKTQRCGGGLEPGNWELHPDATMRIDGGPIEEMELGVEEFVRKLEVVQPKRTQV